MKAKLCFDAANYRKASNSTEVAGPSRPLELAKKKKKKERKTNSKALTRPLYRGRDRS